MNEKEVRELIKKKGKVEAVAMELGVCKATVSHLRSGRAPLTKKVLDYLGVEVKYVRK